MHGRQRGQALPLGLALALVGMLGALVLYNTGRVASDKARLANAADAAAYSGLLWQARAMNFQAYTNRAMVANEVSIAQAVSLRSWASYGSRTAENLAHVLSAVPPLNVYAKGLDQIMAALDGFVGPVAEAMVGVIGVINSGISHAQRAMFVSSFAATPEIVVAVARESDPRFDAETLYSVAGMADNLERWSRFTTEYDADDGDVMASRAKLVNDSRDDFTRERKWRLFERFWLYSTPLTRHKIMREGSTRLVMVEGAGGARWEWKAVDTVSLQNRIYRFIKSEKKQEVPIGWGAALANARGSSSISTGVCSRPRAPAEAHCGPWTPNRTAEAFGRAGTERMAGYEGLDAFRSLDGRLPELESGDPVVRLRTEVALDTSAVRSGDTFVDGEILRANVVAPGDRLSSVSAAELYYRRPDDRRGAALSDEGANGYNPYWTVRLAPVSLEQRLIATGLRATSGSVTPRGTGSPSGPPGPLRPLDAANGIDADAVASAAGERVVGSAAGPLPDYVATLAGGHGFAIDGIDVASLELPSGLAPDFDRFEVADFVGDDFSDIDLDDPGGYIEEKLVGALETAVSDMLRGKLRELGEDALDGLVDPELMSEIEEKVEEGLRISEEFDAARQEVAARMKALEPRLVQMLQERYLSSDFDENPPFGMFDGYDAKALQTIAATFMQVSADVLPEWPVPARMAIEAAKVFYAEYRAQLLASGRPDARTGSPGGPEGAETEAEHAGIEGLEGIAGIEELEAFFEGGGDVPGDARNEAGDERGDDAEAGDGERDPPRRDIGTEPWIESDDDDTWGDIYDPDDGGAGETEEAEDDEEDEYRRVGGERGETDE